MGYTTEFSGQFDLDKPLTEEQKLYLQRFSETRRMELCTKKAEKLDDPVRIAVGLPIGIEGGYFVGNEDKDSIVDYNRPPKEQPGLWCQWIPTEDGTAIVWDGNEKFSYYVEWLEYIITHFIVPWGYKLNGEMKWRGEEFDDIGTITVKDNLVERKESW